MKSLLLALLDAEIRRTAAVLGALPTDGLDFAPHPRAYTLGRLAMHVATLAGWMTSYTEQDGHDMGEAGPGPRQPRDLADLREAFESASSRGRDALAGCDEATLGQVWTLWRDGRVVGQWTRAEAIATFALQHLAHHRGQLTVYLRLREIAVPALYGDSADARLEPSASGPPTESDTLP